MPSFPLNYIQLLYMLLSLLLFVYQPKDQSFATLFLVRASGVSTYTKEYLYLKCVSNPSGPYSSALTASVELYPLATDYSSGIYVSSYSGACQ